eukprot:760825-Hanusia_phi.AAC.1
MWEDDLYWGDGDIPANFTDVSSDDSCSLASSGSADVQVWQHCDKPCRARSDRRGCGGVLCWEADPTRFESDQGGEESSHGPRGWEYDDGPDAGGRLRCSWGRLGRREVDCYDDVRGTETLFVRSRSSGAAGLVQVKLHEILHHRHVREQIPLSARQPVLEREGRRRSRGDRRIRGRGRKKEDNEEERLAARA